MESRGMIVILLIKEDRISIIKIAEKISTLEVPKSWDLNQIKVRE